MTALLVTLAVIACQLGVIVAFVITERRTPTATLAWILLILFLPVIGLLGYVFFGATRMKRTRKRSQAVQSRLKSVLGPFDIGRSLSETRLGAIKEARIHTMLSLGNALTSLPASGGNLCEILPSAAATYRSLAQAISEAQDHIHVEFYIIQPDRTGQALRERLAARAAEGIEVRVLYDAVGSASLPRSFWEPLVAAGGKVAVYKPVRFWGRFVRQDRVDFRNHRKIVVVDGKIGLTGGINVGREYLGLDPEIGHWRDSHVRIEGPAVLSLQNTFAEDWLLAAGEVLGNARYYPAPGAELPGETIVDVIDSGPDQKWSAVHYIYSQAMALAERRLWVTSPYFVPDPVVEQMLSSAALRGVDVRLLLPLRADSMLVTYASRSYYQALLEAGVRIFLYQRGFVHAKTLVVDDWLGTIGSANMDIRSFRLNFELNAVVYGSEFASELARHFEEDLASAKELSKSWYEEQSYGERLVCSAARLFSPVL